MLPTLPWRDPMVQRLSCVAPISWNFKTNLIALKRQKMYEERPGLFNLCVPTVSGKWIAWQDLAKFCHLGKTLKAFGYSLRVYFVLGKILTLIGQIFMTLEKFSWLLMAQYCKDNLAIWSHWKCPPPPSPSLAFSKIISETSASSKAALGSHSASCPHKQNVTLVKFSFCCCFQTSLAKKWPKFLTETWGVLWERNMMHGMYLQLIEFFPAIDSRYETGNQL